jgi:ubiquinone/menaquinone biosynthesis C-methylase UbiE
MKEANADLSSRVEAFFDITAPCYDRSYTTRGTAGKILRARTQVALDLLGPVAGAVLDVGMGPGVICAELDDRGWEVSGIDLSPTMVEAARRRLPHRRDRLVQGSIQRLPFEDQGFDAVVATGVVEYAVDDIDGAVAELARVLRPRGVAVVSFPNQTAPVSIWRGRVVYPLVRLARRVRPARRPPPPRVPIVQFGRFVRALGSAGFEIETVEPVGVMPAPAALAKRLEARRTRLAFFLAVQRVVRARKPA